MYRYYLAQICSPKYYLSHIVLQRRSRKHTHTHNLTSFHCLKIHTLEQTTQINSHKQSNRHKHTQTFSVSYYVYTYISK